MGAVERLVALSLRQRFFVLLCLVALVATGVTTGPMLKGVRRFASGAITHSLVMRSKTRTVRYIEAHHHFDHEGK